MDYALFTFIVGYVIGGWRTGFLRRLLGLGLAALSLVGGAYLRGPVGAIVAPMFGVPKEYADMVGYAATFAVGFIGSNILASAPLKKVAMNGLSRKMDQTLGAVFGLAEAVLLISAAIVILDTYFGSSGSLGKEVGLGFLKSLSEQLDSSSVGQLLSKTTVPFVLAILGPLLPKDVSTLIPRGGIPGLPGLPGSSGFPFPLPTP